MYTLTTIETHDNRLTIETELYIKPTNSGIILHYHTAHPTLTIHNKLGVNFAEQ